ncbi:MAG: BatA and WFA domain-containing protein, partial [Spirochaetaceae bacterium]|nr:BatA and WFA domain-containing protein [Spirochaetaceae bacterium]
MTWDYPLWLISSISLPMIIILHLLVRRRRTIRVPSLVLWERLLENERRSLSFRRLLADALLLLQLLAAALLVLAMASPRSSGGTGRITGPTVLVLDVSAGMSAVEEDGRSRIDDALDNAADMVKSKSSGAEVLILTAGSETRPVSDFVSSRKTLLSTLETIRATDEPGDPRGALKAAESLAAARPGGKVIFFTDGGFDDVPAPGPMTEVVGIGETAENIGLTVFSIRARSNGGLELLFSVENFGTESRDVRMKVLLDGASFYEEELVMDMSERVSRTISWLDTSASLVEVSLTTDGEDRLQSDNEAVAVLVPRGRVRTALITPGNWFLETLLSAHPGISLDVFYGLENWKENKGPWDLIVADRLFPPRDPGGAVLAIYPFVGTEPPLPLRQIGVTGESDPVSWDSGHPVTRDVDFSRVSVRSAARMEVSGGARSLVESSAGPMVLAGETEQRRWTALSFDILDSSLPLRPAFPLMVAGAVSWLVPGDMDGIADIRRTGDEWRPYPERSGEVWEIFAPDGRSFQGEGDDTAAVGSLD